jgi:hypothetical protein
MTYYVWRQVNLELRLTPVAVTQILACLSGTTPAAQGLRRVLEAAAAHVEEKGSAPFRALVEMGQTSADERLGQTSDERWVNDEQA